MNKYKAIDIISGVIMLFAIGFEILNHTKGLGYQNTGIYLSSIALILFIVNQFFKSKNKK